MRQQRRGHKNLHDQNKRAPWRACQAWIKFAQSWERRKIRGEIEEVVGLVDHGRPQSFRNLGSGVAGRRSLASDPGLIFTIRPPVFVQIDPTGE